MSEINLPTSAKQDSIKSDTSYIRNQFPISSGAVRGIQRGCIPAGMISKNSYIDIPISAINVSKSVLILELGSLGDRTSLNGRYGELVIYSATSLRLRSTNTPAIDRDFYYFDIMWQIVEFY